MTKILAFIAQHMGYLWVGARFQIVGSQPGSSKVNAILFVESSRLRLRFLSDRGQLFMDFGPVTGAGPNDWFSIDIVRRMLQGKPEKSAELDPSYAEFVRDNLDEIEARFSEENWPATRETLHKLELQRSKELFG
jgi:hypothetical protein